MASLRKIINFGLILVVLIFTYSTIRARFLDNHAAKSIIYLGIFLFFIIIIFLLNNYTRFPFYLQRRRKQIMLLIISFFIYLIALELAFRVAGIGEPEHKKSSQEIYNLKYPDYERKGFRDNQNLILEKQEGPNILVLGDSFTYGWGVFKNETYSSLLEAELNNFGNQVNVINLGYPGYGTLEERLILSNFSDLSNTSIVLLGFFLNDALDDFKIISNWSIKYPFKEVIIENQLDNNFLVANSRFLRFTVQTIAKMIYYHSFTNNLPMTYEDKFIGWRSVKENFVTIKGICEENDINFLVIIFPAPIDKKGTNVFLDIHNKLHEFLESNEIQYIDLLDAYSAYENKDLWVSSADIHPSKLAHNIASEAIYENIRLLV